VKFKAFDVLANADLRQGIKEYSNWPTIPQLYVKGEFVGGCDIVREMAASGELKELLAEKGVVTADA
jgi:monothiol glutaredoxin